MNALIIARHHLSRIRRNPGLILLLMAVPITLALIEYAAFGPSASSGRLPPIKVLFLDEDRTLASSAVPQFFAGGPMKEYFEVGTAADRAEARRLFQRGEASALIVVPAGFQRALLDGRPVDLLLYKNPIQVFMPDVAASVLDMVVAIANGLYAQAREPIARIRHLVDAREEPSEDDIAEISRGFQRAGRRFARVGALQNLKVEVQRPGSRTDAPTPSSRDFFGFIFPGLVLFGLLFISQTLSLRLLRDRTAGLQRRMVMTPVSRADVLTGGILYLVVALILLLGVLAMLGRLIFGLELRDPLTLAIFGIGFALFAAGLQLAIAGVSRTYQAAQAVVGGVIMVLSLLGGTFVPAETYPPFLRAMAYRLPNGAAQQGIIDVLVHKKAFGEVRGRAAITWVWGIGSLAAAIVLERRKLVQ